MSEPRHHQNRTLQSRAIININPRPLKSSRPSDPKTMRTPTSVTSDEELLLNYTTRAAAKIEHVDISQISVLTGFDPKANRADSPFITAVYKRSGYDDCKMIFGPAEGDTRLEALTNLLSLVEWEMHDMITKNRNMEFETELRVAKLLAEKRAKIASVTKDSPRKRPFEHSVDRKVAVRAREELLVDQQRWGAILAGEEDSGMGTEVSDEETDFEEDEEDSSCTPSWNSIYLSSEFRQARDGLGVVEERR